MKLLVVGAGQMGVRHIKAILQLMPGCRIAVVDNNKENLGSVQKTFSSSVESLSYHSSTEIKGHFDGAIVSTSAFGRAQIIEELVTELGVRNLLIEKPVEQSLLEVDRVVSLLNRHGARGYVNFIRRPIPQYQSFQKLIQDTKAFNSGIKHIVVSGGAVGIAVNGIHLIDLVVWFTNAHSHRVKYARVDSDLIPSGRGPHYRDFGGTFLFDVFNQNEQLAAQIYINLAASSSLPYAFTISGPHGRLAVDEFQKTFTLTTREKNSTLPNYRYFGDYSEISSCPLEVDLEEEVETSGIREWRRSFSARSIQLPEVQATLLTHKILFDWLERAENYSLKFPVT